MSVQLASLFNRKNRFTVLLNVLNMIHIEQLLFIET